MARGIALLVLLLGITWSMLLLPWVSIEEKTLTGSDISQVLVSLPAIAILMALIALYRKFPRSLMLACAAVMISASYLAFATDFTLSPASLQIQESVTGLAGESSLGEQTFWPSVFGSLSAISALMSLWVSFLPVSSKSRVDEPRSDDSRSIWDEQL